VRIVIFSHSLVSDWNHGNAHFLRGFSTELVLRGHRVDVFEPADGWSRTSLIQQQGPGALQEFAEVYPHIKSSLYDPESLDLSRALSGADLVIVHEWNPVELVAAIGRHRAIHGGYRLLFHDTHHRSVTEPEEMESYDLRHYDGVLAYGSIIRDIYLKRGWTSSAWTWHEAADTRVFRPSSTGSYEGDLVWIGNWGDGERSRELREFLIEPVRALKLKARIYGVRYSDAVLEEFAAAGIEYGGWLPNYRVPEIFGRYRVTVHVPRGPYADALPGIPTIRPFEALACGIPLISAPWSDSEALFRSGRDFLTARDGKEMISSLSDVLANAELAASLSASGLETIQARHTCGHRAQELLAIVQGMPQYALTKGAI
jgi:spore maturation protein CgeB